MIQIKREHIALFLILTAGFFLRTFNLGFESLWLDEGIAVKVAHLSLPEIIRERSANAHPPLYFFLLHCWIKIFNDSEFSVRFLSVIFGFLSIYAIFKTGSILFDVKSALVSSFMLGISFFHIIFSREARGYSLITFLSLVSFYYLIRMLRKRSYLDSACYILSGALILYTHACGVFVILGQNIFVLMHLIYFNKNKSLTLTRWVCVQLTVLLLFAPWIRILISQVMLVQKGYWIPRPSPDALLNTFMDYSSGSYFLLIGFFLMILISIIPADKFIRVQSRAGIKIINEPRADEDIGVTEKKWLLLIWLAVPVIIPFLISQVSTPVYLARSTIPALPAFYLLAGYGFSLISSKYAKIPLIGIIIFISLNAISGYYSGPAREDWREAAGYIDRHAEPGDVILFNAGFVRDNVFDYYSKRDDLVKKGFPPETNGIFYFSSTAESDMKGLFPAVEGHERVWVVHSHSRDSRNLINRTLETRYAPLYDKNFSGINIYLFKKRRIN